MIRPERKKFSFSDLRTLILLLILFFVATDTWLRQERTADWEETLWVVVYPINGDGSLISAGYINQLSEADFGEIATFFATQAAIFNLPLQDPVVMKLAPEMKSIPPSPPKDGNIFKVMWWSLKLRYWALIEDSFEEGRADIRIFALFNDPAEHRVLPHSLGLEKGMLGVVHVYADVEQADQNKVVIVHEILHTVGAEDKYSGSSGQPRYPEGYADPELEPLYPQERAEIMGGRIPLSATEAQIPESLTRVMMGEKTALEIHWVRGS